jgi:GNAT superfamily N-acetyltransferase
MPDLNTLNWRPMSEADLDAVAAIALVSFPDHFEGRPMFANRLALAAQGCFVLAEDDGEALGYAVSYPWRIDSAPPVNSLIEAIPEDADVIYLHDLALHPDARRGGATRAIVELLADQARSRGWPAIALVAVNDAVGFWTKQSFEVRENAAVRTKLVSYGPDARYMIRGL